MADASSLPGFVVSCRCHCNAIATNSFIQKVELTKSEPCGCKVPVNKWYGDVPGKKR